MQQETEHTLENEPAEGVASDGLSGPTDDPSLDPEGPAADGAGPEAEEPGELERWKEIAARSQAELDNYRKRMAREKSEAIQYANRGLLEQLLPILDNFEMGLRAAEQQADGAGSMILQGMGMVHKQIGDFLEEQGVQTVPSDGQAFDPNLHEAVKQEPHASVPEGVVVATLRRGYRMRDRLLRAATVVVSAGPPAETEAAE